MALLSLLSLLLVPCFSFGQAGVINTTRFTVTGKALGYSGGGAALVAADAGAEVRLNDQFSARQDNIILSTAVNDANMATFSLGGPEWYPTIKALPAQFRLYAFGEAGIVASSLSTTPAYSVGGGMNYYPSSHPSVAVNLFEVRWLHGNVPVGIGKVAQNGVAFAVGVSFK
jgi:hypothetical protein